MLRRRAGGSADGSSQAVQFCVSPALFATVGSLFVGPAGITVQAIHRLPAHCSLRAHITATEWFAAATAAFDLSTDVANRLFDVFHVIAAAALPPTQRTERTRALLASMQNNTVPDAKLAQRSVPLVPFMLFLMAQVFLERPPRHAPGEHPPEAILNFVKQHLSDMVLVASVGRHARVTATEAMELQLLFREFNGGTEAVFGTNLGHLWGSGQGQAASIDCNALAQFIRHRIVLPADIRGAQSTTVLHQHLQQTLQIVPSAPAPKAQNAVRIAQCSHTTLYVPHPLPMVTITNVSNSVIVLGPVAGLLSVSNCEDCQIVAPCGGLAVTDCRKTVFYVCSNSSPVLSGKTEGIQLAPYNTFYPLLEQHLAAAGVNPSLNLFDTGSAAGHLLPPAQFAPISVPVPPSSSAGLATRANPCTLPAAYAQAQRAKAARAQDTTNMLQSAYKQLEAAGRPDLAQQLRQKVQRSFSEWLEVSGQAQSLSDLMAQTQGPAAGATAAPRGK